MIFSFVLLIFSFFILLSKNNQKKIKESMLNLSIPENIKQDFLNNEISTVNTGTNFEFFSQAQTCEEISEKADLIVIGSPKKDLFDEKVYTSSYSQDGATLTIKYTLPEIKVDEFIKGASKSVKVIQYSYIEKNKYGKFVLTNDFYDWPMTKRESYILFLDRNEKADDEEYFVLDIYNKIQIGGEIVTSGRCRDFILNKYKDKIKKLKIKPVYSKDIKPKVKWETLMIENEAGCVIEGIMSVCNTATGESIPIEKFTKERMATFEATTI